jgi:hypothetical protein
LHAVVVVDIATLRRPRRCHRDRTKMMMQESLGHHHHNLIITIVVFIFISSQSS